MATATGLERITSYRSDIDAALHEFFVQVPQLLGTELSAHSVQALERLEAYCLRPGKRLRGSLAALSYDAASGTEHARQGIQLGVVLELMQGYLLIIDDVMDRSAIRRGEPTMHELYRADQNIDKHEADMIAVNVGLLAQHLSSLLITTIDRPTEAKAQAMSILQRNIGITGLGQLDDISTHAAMGLAEADILRKYKEKTSYYTFVNPLQLGFVLAGKGDESTLADCEAFGIAAGIAFQIHDDYLGMFGDSVDSGKSNLDDLREGKRTILVQYALDHAEASTVTQLQALLGRQEANEADLQTAQAILQASGAVDYAGKLTGDYAQSAQELLEKSQIGDAEFRQLLYELVEYSISRKH